MNEQEMEELVDGLSDALFDALSDIEVRCYHGGTDKSWRRDIEDRLDKHGRRGYTYSAREVPMHDYVTIGVAEKYTDDYEYFLCPKGEDYLRALNRFFAERDAKEIEDEYRRVVRRVIGFLRKET